jgi:hypothetical protein
MPALQEGAKMNDHYQTEKEIEAVVQGFESCTTAKDDFKHRGHLTVAVWYLRNSTLEQAFEKMRAGLFRFLDHHGVGGAKYKEALTLSWLQLIQSVSEQLNPELSLLEVTNIVLERLGDPRVISQHDSLANSGVATEGSRPSDTG